MRQIAISDIKKIEDHLSFYKSLVSMVENGDYEKVGKILRSFRVENPSYIEKLIQLLIGIRVSLKSGNSQIDTTLLSNFKPEHPFFKGEIHFITALTLYQKKDFETGSVQFEKAADCYEDAMEPHKELLSRYNAIIGSLNHTMDDLSVDIINALKLLQKKAYQIGDMKMAGLIHRQNSYYFQDINRYHAALDEAKKSCDLLENFGPASDYQLAICHVVDSMLDLGFEEVEYKKYLEHLVPPVDSRVEFPLAYVNARISKKEINIKGFEHINPRWLEKYHKFFAKNKKDKKQKEVIEYVWNLSSGELDDRATKKKYKVKANSLEGRLLKVLNKGKISKALLIEKLWPEIGETALLDNRLHRLISRLNKKLEGFILFDGTFYTLFAQIEIV